jgi:sugar lactone lactonase YvrE/enterochelin esterase-like enzyme
MRTFILTLIVLVIAPSARPDEYTLGPDSQPQDVPHGVVTQHAITSEKSFPGVHHDYWLYVPAQYDAKSPAAVMVFQDGGGFQDAKGQFRVPVVFDNLIAKKEMPITIAVMINPGVLPPIDPKTQSPRIERSYEYDSPTDLYARFLIEELLPKVAEKYKLTDNPNLRAICGNSSGGMAAFTAAWERPDFFRRVLSNIGSFTDLRGGDRTAALIRKIEPKPLRIFLQSGTNDLNVFAGSWWVANQDVADSLRWAGYDFKFVSGTEGHNGKHGGAIFPDALRWLWRDWDKPITRAPSNPNNSVDDILIHGEEWQVVSEGHRFTEGPAADAAGNIYFSDIPNNQILKVDVAAGKVTTFAKETRAANGLKIGPDGRVYACQMGANRIVAYDPATARMEVIVEGIEQVNDLAITRAGGIYATEPPKKRVWYIAPGSHEKTMVDEGIDFPNGIGLTPDQGQLAVDDTWGVNIYLLQVHPDGSLSHREPFYTAELPAKEHATQADGLCFDTAGRLYVATNLGLQVFDQHGRVMAIINKPQRLWLSNVTFGGKDFDTLFVTCGDKIFKRKTRARGAHPALLTPAKAPPDKLG